MSDVLILTPREMEVLQLVERGKQSRDIAGLMEIAECTVNDHIRNACRKLGVRKRKDAVRIINEQEVVTLNASGLRQQGVLVLPCHACKFQRDCKRRVFDAEFVPFCFPLDMDDRPNWRHQQYVKEYGK